MSDAKEKSITSHGGPLSDPYVQSQQALLKGLVVAGALSFKEFLALAPLEGVEFPRNSDAGRDVAL